MSEPYENVVWKIQQLATEQQRMYRSPPRYGFGRRQCMRLEKIKAELQRLWLERKRARVHFHDTLEDFGEERKFTRVA